MGKRLARKVLRVCRVMEDTTEVPLVTLGGGVETISFNDDAMGVVTTWDKDKRLLGVYHGLNRWPLLVEYEPDAEQLIEDEDDA